MSVILDNRAVWIWLLLTSMVCCSAAQFNCPPGTRPMVTDRGGIREFSCATDDSGGTPVEHGPKKVLGPEGQLALEGTLDHGRASGVWTVYFPNGIPAARGAYALGKRTGQWTYWKPDGTVRERIEYLEGRAIACTLIARSPAGTEVEIRLEPEACEARAAAADRIHW